MCRGARARPSPYLYQRSRRGCLWAVAWARKPAVSRASQTPFQVFFKIRIRIFLKNRARKPAVSRIPCQQDTVQQMRFTACMRAPISVVQVQIGDSAYEGVGEQ